MLFASAVPILPEKATRYRQIAEEIRPHMGEYEALNERYGVAKHAYWISHTRNDGDLGVSVYDISRDGLAAMGGREWDETSPYDRWWLGFVREVNGVDLQFGSAHRAPPEQIFAWERAGA